MKRYSLILGLAIIITVCGNANGSSQPPDSGAPVNQARPAFTTDYMNKAAGAWYYHYREPYLSSTATEPAKIKNINPDFGGLAISDTATTQSSEKQATSMIGDCRVFISSSNMGSRIQPLDLSYIGDDFQRSEFSNVRLLVSEIFSVYENPSTNLGKLRVLRDWIARMAIHPHPPLHAGVDKNTHVLPSGWDWSMFDGISENEQRWARDSQFWDDYGLNGYNMLNRLFNLDGTEAHPMLEKLGPAEYRIKTLTENVNDPEVYRTVLCTYQAEMLITLAGSIGIHGILVSTYGHDTSAFFLPELAKWVYMDPTFNEDYILASSGIVASPRELYVASVKGVARDVFLATKIQGPSWERTVYVDSSDDVRATYLGDSNPYAWIVMGSNLMQFLTKPWFAMNLVMYDAPFFYEYPDDPATVAFSNRKRVSDMEVVFPTLGVSIVRTTPLDQISVSVALASNWPYHDHFEISDEDGIWGPLIGDLVLTVAASKTIQVKSVDKTGCSSTIALMSAICKKRGNAIPAVNLLLLN
jgi:hypothetical protein